MLGFFVNLAGWLGAEVEGVPLVGESLKMRMGGLLFLDFLMLVDFFGGTGVGGSLEEGSEASSGLKSSSLPSSVESKEKFITASSSSSLLSSSAVISSAIIS